jgi:hypothetical protein
MVYDDFASLNLTCRFFNVENLSKLQHQTACFFASPNLNVIIVEVKPYKLRQGTYRMQFILQTSHQTIESGIDESVSFEVLLSP